VQPSARDDYLTTEVTTAPPQKLHLMLIEAAVRSAELARERWRAGQDGSASAALVRAQEILGELLAGLNREADAALAKRVASVYLFVFRNLMQANCQRDEQKLDDAIRVLKVERETWRQVCRQLGPQMHANDRAASTEPPATSGLSLEA
jgi:flagellar protein FliS